MADSPFLKALGTPTIRTAPAQTGELVQRAVEEWKRNVCGNKAVAILKKKARRQNGSHQERWRRNAHHRTRQAALRSSGARDDPDAFMLEITKIILNKHAHPVIAQMLHPDVPDDLPPSECAPTSSEGQSSRTATADHTQPSTQFQ